MYSKSIKFALFVLTSLLLLTLPAAASTESGDSGLITAATADSNTPNSGDSGL